MWVIIMNKRKKDDLYESKWEVFLRNYHNVPGFKALVKLGGYFIFFLVFILIINYGTSGLSEEKNNNSLESSPTKTESSKKYKDILDDFATRKSEIEVLYSINTDKTKISAIYENKILIGTIENEMGIKKFKIQNSEIYEVLLDNETLNSNLFGNMNPDFLNPANLAVIFNANQATKRIEDDKVLYSYSINYKSIDYNIIVKVVNESINSIEITNDNEVYSIIYK